MHFQLESKKELKVINLKADSRLPHKLLESKKGIERTNYAKLVAQVVLGYLESKKKELKAGAHLKRDVAAGSGVLKSKKELKDELVYPLKRSCVDLNPERNWKAFEAAKGSAACLSFTRIQKEGLEEIVRLVWCGDGVWVSLVFLKALIGLRIPASAGVV